MIFAIAIFLTGLFAAPATADPVVSLSVSAWSLVHGFGSGQTVSEARDASMKECSKSARKCRVTVVRAGECISFAVDEQNVGWGWGKGETTSEAEAQSVALCSDYNNNTACEVVETRCGIKKKEG